MLIDKYAHKMVEQIMNNNFGASLLPPSEEGLKWLFLDLNSYFASVEQNDNPKYHGRPLIVAPSATDATAAIAVSYEAKAFGIRNGTKVYEAKKMCPGLICIQADHEKYVDYHHRIIAATEKVIPVNKTWSVDEFDCLLMGKQREPQNAIQLAKDIKQQLHQDIGPMINCSIGISSNSFLAKVGTELQKPNGLVVLHPDDLPGKLLEMELPDLPGISHGIHTRLLKCGISTVEQLYNISPKQARATWHSVNGERFWYWLHGYDVPHVKTKPSMLGHSRILDPQIQSPGKTYQMGRRLLFKACTRMRRKKLYCKELVVKLTFLNGQKWGCVREFPASNDPFYIMKLYQDIWTQMERECAFVLSQNYNNKRMFLKISTLLRGLCYKTEITDDLFEQNISRDLKQAEKHQKLATAMEHLQKKYKSETVWLGIVPETLAGNVGTKIAFNRVPEKEEFWH